MLPLGFFTKLIAPLFFPMGLYLSNKSKPFNDFMHKIKSQIDKLTDSIGLVFKIPLYIILVLFGVVCLMVVRTILRRL